MRKEIIKRTLKNGIDVYLYIDKNLKRTIASYNVNYGFLGYYNKFYYKGNLHEVPQGMAHFLEHLLIEESKYGNMLLRFKNKSYNTNGATSLKMTRFYFIGIKDVKESIKELINMIDDPVFTEESVEKVKSAIISEVAMVGDDKYRIEHNINLRNVFSNFETVGEDLNTLGTKESTENITYEQVKACYDAYYHDQNKFLLIGGNFEEDEMIEYLESIYEEIKPHKNEMTPFDYGNEFAVRKEYDELIREIDFERLTLTYKFKNNYNIPKIMIDLYLSIFLRLKFSGDTKFVENLIKDGIITGGLSTDTDCIGNVILMSFLAKVQDKDEFVRRIENELNTDGLDQKLFDLIKRNWKVHEVSKIDDIYYALSVFPLDITYTEKLYCIDKIDECTLQNLKDFIETLDFSTKVVTVMKSNKENKKVD